jgi:hypothetical protein
MFTGSLSRQVNHELWWIDVVVVVTFCVLVALGWHDSEKKYPDKGSDEVWLRIADGLRAAASAGLTVVAILLPTTVIVVLLSVTTSEKLLVAHAAAANLYSSSAVLLIVAEQPSHPRLERKSRLAGA